MTKYIVVELQTDASGAVGNIITAHDTLNEAESHFYSILAAAAVSAIAKHAAVLMTSEGYLVESRCFEHGTEAANVD